MRRIAATLIILLLSSPQLVSAQPVHYDEAVDGDIPFIEGIGWPLTLTLAPGANTITGVLTRTPDATDMDAFQFVVPEGQQVDSIQYDYSTTFYVNNGVANYFFYLDNAVNPAPYELVSVTTTPSDSRQFFPDLMPLGPGEYRIGRQGSGIFNENAYDVAFTYTITVSGEPEGIAIDVPELRYEARPVIDGNLSWQEWKPANRLAIDNGFMAFAHDSDRLYVLIDMLSDTGDDAFVAGGGDQFWLYFDVDRDGAITPDVDLRYRLVSGTGNMRYETFCDGCLFGFNPPNATTWSARGEGFGCFREDNSLSFIPLSCQSHRVWELAIDLREIGLAGDSDIRMGYLVSSGVPSLTENFPADLNNLAGFAQLTLAGAARSIPAYPSDSGDPQFEVTQAIQTPQNDLDLSAGKPTTVRVWSTVEADQSNVFVYGQQGGIDLPGSPLLENIFLSAYYQPANSRDSAIRFVPLPASWSAGGTVNFDVLVRGYDNSLAPALDAGIDFVPTRRPVFWTMPIRNTAQNGAVTTINEAWITQAEQALLRATPLEDVQFVRRPILDVTNVTSSSMLKEDLRVYDQQTLLVWTIGLLFLGEPPFDLPDQITGFNGTGYGMTAGSSDPLWSGGAARIAWITPNNTGGVYGYAHELNHNLDYRPASTANWGFHSRGCGVSDDPAWPYGSSFTIQEVGAIWFGTGFDTVGADRPDFMSYCSGSGPPPVWISPYRWQAWLDVFRTDNPLAAPLNARASGSALGAAALAAPVDSFYIVGRVYPDGTGELGQILRQAGVPTGGNPVGALAVQVLDCSAGVIAEERFTPSFVGVEGDAEDFVSFDFVMPASVGACSIVLRDDSNSLDSRTISANPPVVSLVSPNGGETWDGEATVSWQAGDDDGDALLFTLLYSANGGMTWEPMATRIAGTQYELDSSRLPGSDDARVRILVSDGANTSQDDSDAAFTVVEKPPRVTIVGPADNGVFDIGEPQLLQGLARDTFGNRLPDDGLLWVVDGLPVGMGADARVFLEEGIHQVGLLYLEGDVPVPGAAAAITIELVSPPDADGDGIPDAADNCIDVANGPLLPDAGGASQLDSDGDGFGNLCDADLDNSGGIVNFADLALFRAAFGTGNANADLDGSGGIVNFADLARFRAMFGRPPGPSGVAP